MNSELHTFEEVTPYSYNVISYNGVHWADLICCEDGFFNVWFLNSGGYLTQHDLECVASKLQDLNAGWQESIDEYFEEQDGKV